MGHTFFFLCSVCLVIFKYWHCSRDSGFWYVSLRNNEFCSSRRLPWLSSNSKPHLSQQWAAEPLLSFLSLQPQLLAESLESLPCLCALGISHGIRQGLYTDFRAYPLLTLLFLGFPPASVPALNSVFWYLNPVRLLLFPTQHWTAWIRGYPQAKKPHNTNLTHGGPVSPRIDFSISSCFW